MRQALGAATGAGVSRSSSAWRKRARISTRPFQLVTGRVWKGSAFGGARRRHRCAEDRRLVYGQPSSTSTPDHPRPSRPDQRRLRPDEARRVRSLSVVVGLKNAAMPFETSQRLWAAGRVSPRSRGNRALACVFGLRAAPGVTNRCRCCLSRRPHLHRDLPLKAGAQRQRPNYMGL